MLQGSEGVLRFQLRSRGRRVADGQVSRIGNAAAFFEVTTDSEPYTEAVRHGSHRDSLVGIIDYLHRNGYLDAILSIHTVVHRVPATMGHPTRAMAVDRGSIASLHPLATLSPDAYAAVSTLDSALRTLPSATHIVVFTAAPYAGLLAHTLPLSLRAATVSAPVHDDLAHAAALDAAYAHARRVPRRMVHRAVSVHIGETASVTAFLDGVVVDTTDGSPGALPGLHDAGALPAHIVSSLRQSIRQDAGLAAMTGRDSYADILAGARAGDIMCVRALMLLASRVAYAVAGMTAALGGLDTLVFSGNGASWPVREEACRRLAHFGVVLDSHAARHDIGVCSAPRSRVLVLGVDANEWSALHAEALAFSRNPSKKA